MQVIFVYYKDARNSGKYPDSLLLNPAINTISIEQVYIHLYNTYFTRYFVALGPLHKIVTLRELIFSDKNTSSYF